MSPGRRLTCGQKGKEVAAVSSLGKDPETVHREAMMDMASLDLAQRLLVSDAMGQFRAEDGGQDAMMIH